MLAAPAPPRVRSAGPIAALTLIFLGAMAFAIPPAPIESKVEGDAARGYLVGHSRFSDTMAEQFARNGYTFLAIDLTRARLDDDALWREHLEAVGSRRFPVWGWFDLRAGEERAAKLVRALNLAGLFVYGPGSVQAAADLRRERPALRVLPVLREQDPAPSAGEYAVALTADRFPGGAAFPVLIADGMDAAAVAAARKTADGDYLIAGVAILDY